jgi:hypothetical protein
MTVNVDAEFCIKNVSKEVVEGFCFNDCLKIIMAEAFKKIEYDCEISKISVKSVQ